MIIQELKTIQEEHGYLPAEALQALSRRLNVPLYRLHGVASFYPEFRFEAPPKVEVQARAILEMQLQKLTGLERQKLIDEYKGLIQLIAELQEILANESVLRNLIIKELREVQREYGDERRTQIIEAGAELTLEDLIADEDMAITVTHSGYIKRTPQGRVATANAYRKLGLKPPGGMQAELL